MTIMVLFKDHSGSDIVHLWVYGKLIRTMQSGVPEEDILILPGDARSTRDEALAVKKYLQAHSEVDSLIIATSPTHSARAKKIFQWAAADLGREVRVISCPSRYVEFDAGNWWKDREDASQVFLEHVKMMHFYLEK